MGDAFWKKIFEKKGSIYSKRVIGDKEG